MTTRKRLANVGDVVAAIDRTIGALEGARDLWPVLSDHASRAWPPGGRYEAVEAQDQAALLGFLRALQALQAATAGMQRRLPALAGPEGAQARQAVAEAKGCADCGTARGPFRRGRCDRCRKRHDRQRQAGPSDHPNATDEGDHRHGHAA